MADKSNDKPVCNPAEMKAKDYNNPNCEVKFDSRILTPEEKAEGRKLYQKLQGSAIHTLNPEVSNGAQQNRFAEAIVGIAGMAKAYDSALKEVRMNELAGNAQKNDALLSQCHENAGELTPTQTAACGAVTKVIKARIH